MSRWAKDAEESCAERQISEIADLFDPEEPISLASGASPTPQDEMDQFDEPLAPQPKSAPTTIPIPSNNNWKKLKTGVKTMTATSRWAKDAKESGVYRQIADLLAPEEPFPPVSGTSSRVKHNVDEF